LAQLLPDFDNASSGPMSTQALMGAFAVFANKRQPRTAALVKGARVEGGRRVVVGGSAACKERDDLVRRQWIDGAALDSRFDPTLKEPFP
jgi:salicylate hydroxylase